MNLIGNSSDTSGNISFSASNTMFKFTDVGINIIGTFTVTDQSRNSSSCPIELNLSESINYCACLSNVTASICKTKNITVYLDASGNASKTPSIFNPNYFKTSLENKGNYVDIQGEYLQFISSLCYKEISELEFVICNEWMQLISSNFGKYNITIPNVFLDLPLNEFYGENRFIIQLAYSIEADKPYVLVVSDSQFKEFFKI